MLFFFLRKFSVSTSFVHVIVVISLSGISVESYMLYCPRFYLINLIYFHRFPGGISNLPDPSAISAEVGNSLASSILEA